MSWNRCKRTRQHSRMMRDHSRGIMHQETGLVCFVCAMNVHLMGRYVVCIWTVESASSTDMAGIVNNTVKVCSSSQPLWTTPCRNTYVHLEHKLQLAVPCVCEGVGSSVQVNWPRCGRTEQSSTCLRVSSTHAIIARLFCLFRTQNLHASSASVCASWILAALKPQVQGQI